MTRRLLGPIGRPIAFFLIAGLVFAGLTWVTVAALHVEDAQREAARRADREKELRIALWRLDARMLPALGVEDTRAFHEFRTWSPDEPVTIYGPGSAPLLAAELPDWMQLHFQLDPETGWDSPQVLTNETRVDLRRNWREVSLRNATPARRELLAALNAKFPAKLAAEAFASRERAQPSSSPPAATPGSAALHVDEDSADRSERKKLPPPETEALPKPAPIPTSGAEAKAPAFGLEDGLALRSEASNSKQIDLAKKRVAETIGNTSAPPPAPEPRPTPQPTPPQQQQDLKFAEQKPAKAEPANRSYEDRQNTLDKAFNDARGAAGLNQLQFNPQSLPYRLNNSTRPGDKEQFAKNGTQLKRDESDKQKDHADGRYLGRATNELEFKKMDSEPQAFFRAIEEARAKERERRQMDNLHRGALKPESLAEKGAAPAGGAMSEPKAKADANGAMAKALPAPAAPTGPPPVPSGSPKPEFGFAGGGPPPGSPLGAAPGFGAPRPAALPKAPGLAGPAPSAPAPEAPRIAAADVGPAAGAPVRRRVDPTPDPAPPAMLEAADATAAIIPPAAPIDEPAGPPPLAVHLGTMRPQWITAPDGTLYLVLVRSARVENKKTVYQGVVLDWPRLEAVLKEEVQDLFPEATLSPVREPNAATREQSMTALPVHLDPGPSPESPPAGWTPLRIGLVIAWVAAAIAFTAVGLSSWSLVDLAERRIRFVSAVTHELRTPLTSLRLYLDLLLSGMVQDEEKRREYLATLNLESDRLHRLIDNVLDFAKLERRSKSRELQPVKAAEMLDAIRQTWSDRVAADGKELVVTSTLPADQGVLTDSSLVQQIVGNLIDNARKYTRDATDQRIWLWARVEGGSRLVLEVEDRGAGVPPREQKLIFYPFRRGESADTKAGGAGLGLALSREWASLLGGKLTYRPAEAGTGSIFRLELPLK
jgi:signal transduction histidine kinase